ncbi:IS3 family transposase, partial [Bacillus pseudomycoides]
MFYLNYYQTKEELIQAIEAYIHHYNYKRFQKRLSHRAPIEYRISMAKPFLVLVQKLYGSCNESSKLGHTDTSTLKKDV